MREIFRNSPAPEFIKYILKPLLLKDANSSFKYFNDINKAHLLMLVKENIVSIEVAKKIFMAMHNVEKKGISNISLDAKKEDLYSNIEEDIMQQCGAEIGGQLHTGRSRNDLGGTVTRMMVRKGLLSSCQQLNELRACLLELAEKHTETVCTGYTCAQPAEPVTVAYYFTAHLFSMERDFTRLVSGYDRVNLCPLGSGAMASTTFKINRAMVAQLLGFSAETHNSLDGIASRDYILEIISALSIFMINLSRLCQDLYMWSTNEFSLIEIDSSVAMCSSLMPQKKNPVTLEHVKAKAAHLQAAYISASSALKNTPYTQVRDSSIETAHYLWDAINEVEAAVQLMLATLRTLTINEQRMLELAKNNFCTVSELANVLVKECNISFRQAHSIVGRVVLYLLENHLKPKDINGTLLKNITKETIFKEISISETKIREALDPKQNAFSRNVSGGPSPYQVRLQLQHIREQLEKDKTMVMTKIETLELAETDLNKRIDSFLKE